MWSMAGVTLPDDYEDSVDKSVIQAKARARTKTAERQQQQKNKRTVKQADNSTGATKPEPRMANVKKALHEKTTSLSVTGVPIHGVGEALMEAAAEIEGAVVLNIRDTNSGGDDLESARELFDDDRTSWLPNAEIDEVGTCLKLTTREIRENARARIPAATQPADVPEFEALRWATDSRGGNFLVKHRRGGVRRVNGTTSRESWHNVRGLGFVRAFSCILAHVRAVGIDRITPKHRATLQGWHIKAKKRPAAWFGVGGELRALWESAGALMAIKHGGSKPGAKPPPASPLETALPEAATASADPSGATQTEVVEPPASPLGTALPEATPATTSQPGAALPDAKQKIWLNADRGCWIEGPDGRLERVPRRIAYERGWRPIAATDADTATTGPGDPELTHGPLIEIEVQDQSEADLPTVDLPNLPWLVDLKQLRKQQEAEDVPNKTPLRCNGVEIWGKAVLAPDGSGVVPRIILPSASEADDLVTSAWDWSHGSHHRGLDESIRRFQNISWMKNARKRLRRLYRKCKTFPRIRGHKSVSPHGNPLKSTIGRSPFDVIYVDFVGPISPPTFYRGRKCSYIATAIAALPRWPWFTPTPNATAETFTEFLTQGVTFDILAGAPLAFRSDRGPHFIAEMTQELGRSLGSDWLLGSPYNSRSQALPEAAQSKLSAYLRAGFLGRAVAADWGGDVKRAQWISRTAGTFIGTAPYEMLLGFVPRLGMSGGCCDTFWGEFWSGRLDRLREMTGEVLADWKQQQEQDNRQPAKMQAGALCWVKRETIDRELDQRGAATSRRLQPQAGGPFRVKADLGAAVDLEHVGSGTHVRANKRRIFVF